MTTRTIEYTETVTRSDDVDVCEECGRAERPEYGDVLTFTPPTDEVLAGSIDALHYHERCLDDMRGTTAHADTLAGVIADHRDVAMGGVHFAFDTDDIILALGGAVFIAIGLAAAGSGHFAGIAIMLFGLLAMYLGFNGARDKANAPVYAPTP